MAQTNTLHTPVLVIHGGALHNLPEAFFGPEVKKWKLDGIRRAARAGYSALVADQELKDGDTNAVTAVVEAVTALENDGNFNAGCGSNLNADGHVRMDATLMNGKNLKCGGVIGVSNIQNPIRLARDVMYKTKHCLLTSQYANNFAEEMGVPFYEEEKLISGRSKRVHQRTLDRLAKEQHEQEATAAELDKEHDTVGAVALDCHGNMAYATSTGGLSHVKAGRVGDSALPGCGGYADNQIGACSTTGSGETIMRVTVAARAIFYLELGQTPEEAMKNAIQYMVDRIGEFAGGILLDKNGEVGLAVSPETNVMSFAVVKDGKIKFGIHPDEFQFEDL